MVQITPNRVARIGYVGQLNCGVYLEVNRKRRLDTLPEEGMNAIYVQQKVHGDQDTVLNNSTGNLF